MNTNTLAVVLAIGLGSPFAVAQVCDSTWQPSPRARPGVEGVVTSSLATTDGGLVVAGTFREAEGLAVGNVARWDGTRWTGLGEGLDGPVFALGQLPNGAIIAGGAFRHAGSVEADRVAVWDGERWSSLGDGFDGPVRSIAVLSDGTLVAGGTFAHSGTSEVHRIGVWNGSAWTTLGTGVQGRGVLALDVLSDGSLLIGGEFGAAGGLPASNIARWDGAAWESLGSGASGPVFSLTALPEGGALVAGAFLTAGGLQANRVAIWNSTGWSTLGSGVGGPVLASCVSPEGELLIGGSFRTSGASTVERFARWTGSAWVGAGPLLDGNVLSLLSLPGSEVAVGGAFRTAGGVASNGVAWLAQGTTRATATGLPSHTDCVTFAANGDAIVGGRFGSLGRGYIARLTNDQWQSIGTGVNGPVLDVLEMPNGEIWAVGHMFIPATSSSMGAASWNGSAWVPRGALLGVGNSIVRSPGGTIFANGDGNSPYFFSANQEWSRLLPGDFNARRFHALAILPDNRLVVAGEFRDMRTVAANSIAAWDGVAWSPLGGGIVGVVYALAVAPTGELIAGGEFTTAGGLPADSIAAWNGNAWRPLGSGIRGVVKDIHVLPNGDIVAGGDFDLAGGVPVTNLARWNGFAWSAEGGALNGAVSDIASASDGRVVMTGSFTRIGNTGTEGFAIYRGGSFILSQPEAVHASLGSAVGFDVGVSCEGASYQWRREGVNLADGGRVAGSNSPHLRLSSFELGDQGLYTCYVFTAGGGEVSAPAELSCRARITAVPRDVDVLSGRTAVLAPTVDVFTATGFQWYHDGTPLTDSAEYSGTTGVELTIRAERQDQTGLYSLVATGECGDSATSPIGVTVRCAADVDGVNGVDGDDTIAFFALWDEANPAADLNGDATIDFEDVSFYFERWDTGC